jgi:hypothetical protein
LNPLAHRRAPWLVDSHSGAGDVPFKKLRFHTQQRGPKGPFGPLSVGVGLGLWSLYGFAWRSCGRWAPAQLRCGAHRCTTLRRPSSSPSGYLPPVAPNPPHSACAAPCCCSFSSSRPHARTHARTPTHAQIHALTHALTHTYVHIYTHARVNTRSHRHAAPRHARL